MYTATLSKSKGMANVRMDNKKGNKTEKVMVVGMKVHYRIVECEGLIGRDNYYESVPFYTLCIVRGRDKKQKTELTMYEKSGCCSSGYTDASYVYASCMDVNYFGALTHRPINNTISLKLPPRFFDNAYDQDQSNEFVYKCEIFDFYDSNSDWYAMSSLRVKMDLFKPTGRGYDKPVVWMLKGESNLGKSYIAHSTSLKVYETDASKKLPKVLDADVVVVGNKYKFELDFIKGRFPVECEFIMVDFGR